MTGPFSQDPFEARRLGLEEEYFRTKDVALVQKLKTVFDAKTSEAEIRAATGITSQAVLDRLAALQMHGAVLAAFKLLPLVEIAWADGSVDAREAKAIIDSAIRSGVPREGPAIEQLEEWIKRGPAEDGRAVWKMYAEELRKTLSADELATFRDDLLGYAKAVAEASGGVLGMVFQISPSEQRVIDDISKRLTH